MSKKIAQVIKNNIDLADGKKIIIFEDVTVTALGIQAPPGTQFSINGDSDMEMGPFGIYELDLERIGGIVSSLTLTAPAKNASQGAQIIIDYIYESGRG